MLKKNNKNISIAAQTKPGAPNSMFASEADRIIHEIHNNYDAGLKRYLHKRLNSKDDTDDVAQDVYLKLIQYPKLKEVKPSLAYIKKIASNLLADRFRNRNQLARSKKYHVPIEDVDIHSPEASPEELLRSKEGMDMINSVVKSVNKNSRRAFLLNRFKGLTYEEIAKKMGISRSMVRNHITSVLFELSKKFESYHDEK